MPDFDDLGLVPGKPTWLQVFRACHLKGVAGAPSVLDRRPWQARLTRGRQTQYDSAINDIPTVQGWRMPPCGGMDQLTDAEVYLAVDYMMAARARIATQNQH